jgi:glutathione S-transferase
MLVVHHLNNSRSQRVLWLLEELGLDYEIRTYSRDARMRAPPELRAIHPLGKSPVLGDGDRVVVESAVIIEYVLDRYGGGRLRPAAGGDDFERYRYFMHYAEGSAMPPLVMKLVFEAMPRQPMPCFARPVVARVAGAVLGKFIDPEVKRHVDYLEGELGARDWFAGADFSAADVQMSFPVEAMRSRGGDDFERRAPRLTDFIARVRARPAYQRAVARGGPFEMLK